MSQLCLYLDDATMSKLRCESEKANRSLSRYVSDLINEQRIASAWPEGYWSIYGALKDPSFVVPAELSLSADGPLPEF